MRRRPIHESPTEKIEFVHSIFIVIYWFTPSRSEYPDYYRHVIRKRPYNSNQRTASPMVYSRVGDAERTCRDLNERYGTDRFQVRRVFHLCTPRFEPWRIKAAIRDKKYALRRKQKRYEEALVRKAKQKAAREKELAAYREKELIAREKQKAAQEKELNPYRVVGDYASVEHLMKPKFFDFIKHRKRGREEDD